MYTHSRFNFVEHGWNELFSFILIPMLLIVVVFSSIFNFSCRFLYAITTKARWFLPTLSSLLGKLRLSFSFSIQFSTRLCIKLRCFAGFADKHPKQTYTHALVDWLARMYTHTHTVVCCCQWCNFKSIIIFHQTMNWVASSRWVWVSWEYTHMR